MSDDDKYYQDDEQDEQDEQDEYDEQDDEQDDKDEWDNIYKPEMKVKERVGLPGSVMVVSKPKTRLENSQMDPLDRFRFYLDGICRSLKSYQVSITEQDIEKMLVYSAELENIGYKNPTCYVLGYLVTDGGKKIDKSRFDQVIKTVLPHSEHQESVLPADIIRYSRLWMTLTLT